MALRFLASGCFQREDGDLHGVSQSGVSKIVHKVFREIAALKTRFINFPSVLEQQTIQTAFYQQHGFPNVIGAIDCTHIPIIRPGGEDGELYRNRKGWFSINVQLLCDDKMKILNVVASWMGSTHDSRIFNESVLKDKLEDVQNRFHILGDRGYPCLRYLMTPLSNPQTAAEKRYNYAQSATRMVIERLNGVIKRRFPCLSNQLRFKPYKCATIIVACCVLHNFGLVHADVEQDDELQNQERDDDDDPAANNANAQGAAKRRVLIERNFL